MYNSAYLPKRLLHCKPKKTITIQTITVQTIANNYSNSHIIPVGVVEGFPNFKMAQLTAKVLNMLVPYDTGFFNCNSFIQVRLNRLFLDRVRGHRMTSCTAQSLITIERYLSKQENLKRATVSNQGFGQCK